MRLREALRYLTDGLRVDLHPETVQYAGTRWTSTHTFFGLFSGPVCWSSSDDDDNVWKWAFDVDELGWGGIRAPNTGVYDTFDDLVNGVAAILARGFGVPVHLKWTPPTTPTPPTTTGTRLEMIERSLAVGEDVEAKRVVDGVPGRPFVDFMTVHLRDSASVVTATDVQRVSVTTVRWSRGSVVEEHDTVFVRTDAARVSELTAGFWCASRREFVEISWHPRRVFTWCLPTDELRDLGVHS